VVALWQCVGYFEIQHGELPWKVSPALGERRRAVCGAAVKTAQDKEEQIVRERAEAVLVAGRAQPATEEILPSHWRL
jgi:hypothetical protein